MKNHKILITGGAGYIGSHTVIKLLELGFSIVILDNFSNSTYRIIKKIKEITNNNFEIIKGDITDRRILKNIFKKYKIKSVIHFAGLKSVNESDKFPLSYYENNVIGSINLIKEMELANIKNLVFSSSATVYGNQNNHLYKEDAPLSPINTYGRTKLIIEEILRSICNIDPEWRAIIFRYFNPIGAHESGLIGDNPINCPNNLLPFICQVAIGKRKKLFVFGDDYPTSDGTGKRDYIHVEDLANAHALSINYFEKTNNSFSVFNLGTGKSFSVLEVIKAFEEATSIKIPYQIVKRRDGDVCESLADPSKAKLELGWEAKFDLKRMCIDSWRWQSINPKGI